MSRVLDEIAHQVPALRRYARALTHDREWADDLVQDCIERALRRQILWRPTGSVRSWLFRILLNLFRNELRSRRRSYKSVSIEALPSELSIPSQQFGHVALLEVAKAIDRLPLEQREALLLVTMEGFAYAEAAEGPRNPGGNSDVPTRPGQIGDPAGDTRRRHEAASCEMNPNPPVTPDELQAFVDHELSVDRHRVVEAYIQATPEAEATVADWTRQRDMIAALYGGVAYEVVPNRLDPRSVQQSRTRSRAHWSLAAAACALMLIGAAGGWEAARYRAADTSSDPLIVSAISAHQFYTGDAAHPVEMRAEDGSVLQAWLSRRLDRSIHLPDLQSFGLHLIGGRLLPNDAGAAAQLMYEDAEGHRLTLYVTPSMTGNDVPFAHARSKQLEAVFWSDEGIRCAVVGALPLDRLQGIAKAAYRQLV